MYEKIDTILIQFVIICKYIKTFYISYKLQKKVASFPIFYPLSFDICIIFQGYMVVTQFKYSKKKYTLQKYRTRNITYKLAKNLIFIQMNYFYARMNVLIFNNIILSFQSNMTCDIRTNMYSKCSTQIIV